MDDSELFTVLPPPDKETPGESPDAPYGYKPDGTPYKRRPSGPRATKTGGGRAGKAAEVDKAVLGAVTMAWGLIVTVLATLARVFKSTPLMADAIVTNQASAKTVPPLTEIIKGNDALVAICIRLSAITPGVELATALLPLIGQIAANHGMVPGAETQAEKIVRAYQAEQPESQERADPGPDSGAARTARAAEQERWVAQGKMTSDEWAAATQYGMTEEEWASAQHGNYEDLPTS